MAIASIMTQVGMSMSIASLYTALVQYYTNLGYKFPKACAAGSIGGSVHNAFIRLDPLGCYHRIR